MTRIMSSQLIQKYPHLQFKKHWKITQNVLMLLGQCEAYVRAVSNTPILPDHHAQLLNLSLIKGAQATTAIEGNTLTEEEIIQIQKGKHLPPSKEYQEIEVRNILDAFNELLQEVVYEDQTYTITRELILRFHKLVGKDLGKHFDAIPGKLRTDDRIVGTYRCPDHQDVVPLVNEYCKWLLSEFHYDSGQEFYENILQAIVAHVYLEWIHPFGDGNGRTGRLLEFYILLRGGNPDIASHILSNHYNQTRPEYYRQLENASRKRDLTAFIEYALLGLRDGLFATLEIIQSSQFQITWKNLIYDKFAEKKYKRIEVFKRQRNLILSLPTDREFTLDEITLITPEIARLYATVSERTLLRDLEELADMELIRYERKKYTANIRLLRLKGYLPQ